MLTGAKAKELTPRKDGLVIEQSDGACTTIQAERILVAAGRKPAAEGWGLEAFDLDIDGPFIDVDDRCGTSMHGVYAIGDVTGEQMRAHRMSAQSEMVAETVTGKRRAWDRT